MNEALVYLILSLPLVAAFAMFALGIVVIYQASRVLNLAHGAMAMVPAYVTYSLTKGGVPVPLALIGGVVSGGLLGVIVEGTFVRRLRSVSTTAQTVGTVAVLGVLVAVAAKVWGTTPLKAPGVFPDGHLSVGASILRYGQIGLFGVACVSAATLFALFRYTDIGLAMRASAENRRAAALMGVNPNLTASFAWFLGGGLAAVAGILLASVTHLHPYNLALAVLPAFVAALIGGLENLPGALVGATVVGVAQGMVPAMALIPGARGFATQVGAPQVVLTVVAFVVMAARGQRFTGASTGEGI